MSRVTGVVVVVALASAGVPVRAAPPDSPGTGSTAGDRAGAVEPSSSEAVEDVPIRRPRTRDGGEMMAGGGLLASLGLLAVGTGAWFRGCTEACTTMGIFNGRTPQPGYGTALVVAGAASLAIGTPLIVLGARRHLLHRRAPRVSVAAAPIGAARDRRAGTAPGRRLPRGWTASLHVRF